MNTLYEQICVIYPNLLPADFIFNIILKDDSDGRGSYIYQWNSMLPIPTQEQLNSTVIKTILPPKQVTMKQARMCFIIRGLFTQIENAILSLVGIEGELAKTSWEYSTVVDRNDALVTQITAALGFTEQQVNELFIFAASL
jgi:hypothetical protein